MTRLIIYRYCFKGFIADQSATVPITFFTPGADDVVGYTCSELIAMHDGEDPQDIPSQIFDVEGQTNVFQIRFNQTGDTTSFILDQVFDKKTRQQPQHKPVEMIEGKSLLLQNFPSLKIPCAITNIKYDLKKQDHRHPFSH